MPLISDYNSVVEYLYNSVPLFQQQGAAAYKPGLQTTIALDEHLGRPHERYTTIHVAGTNGKGSCCHTLAAIFQTVGYRTGLYTSPHLLDMRERIRVNGRMIPKQRVLDFVNRHKDFFEPLKPSFFELMTAMAFDYFAQEKVDVAIIETGLGGRLDCTNIIKPALSIITNVSYDHTQLLGDTLAQIASEKAGIMKAGIPVVIGESCPETRSVYESRAADVGTTITFAEDAPEVLSYKRIVNDGSSGAVSGFRYSTQNFGAFFGELYGICQPRNANTILVALRELKISEPSLKIPQEAVKKGFAECCNMTGLMGRWQKLSSRPDVFCDTGHNTGGWEYLSRQLSELADSYKRLHVVFGMAGDKDAGKVMGMLPAAATYYWTQASVKRAMPVSQLQKLSAEKALCGKIYPTVAAAVQAARRAAASGDAVFIGGSTFIVAEALPLF